VRPRSIGRIPAHQRGLRVFVSSAATTLERRPGERYALQLLGTAYRRLGRQDDAGFALAVGSAGEPSTLDPWSDEVRQYRRGFATLLKDATREAMDGRFDRAIPLFDQLRARKPEDVGLANHLADVLVAAGRQDEALAIATPLVQRGTANAGTYLTIASAHLAAGDAAAAESWTDRALAVDAPGARAHELKGMIAWRSGRRADAVRFLRAGLDRDPRSAKLLVRLGVIHLEDGDSRAALEAFSVVLRREPMHAEALAGLAMAHAMLGARDEAARALARAEQIAPQHPSVVAARAKLEGRSQ
jgi:Flp pilus assembly protein TadD